ncbi:4Fe-4S ferredoxin iron-sulfur binding domain-containing protein [gut metagenome]|uniref:4Fe-4S ferredoxin iron-sulfur binding domain-containing protein n=1 Tax=gut metagenome TaxID=749906 RepID=J9GHU7_9ZZZZ
MKITDVYGVSFSPTHTSQQVGEAIVQGIEAENTFTLDLTHVTDISKEIPATALTVFTVPVYGGHVAPLALQRMNQIRAEKGAPAVVVVVYGNRAYEKALEQLEEFVSERGFKVIAGGTFVGEHSYSSDRYPIATGRPNVDDLAYARVFGEKVRNKVETAIDSEHLYAVDVRKIVRPHQSMFSLLRFLYHIIKWRKTGQPMPRAPKTDENLCTHCGKCVSLCPNQAIVKGEEQHTDVDRCIRCCACVKGCPQKARTFDTPFAPLLSRCFKREKENRILV